MISASKHVAFSCATLLILFVTTSVSINCYRCEGRDSDNPFQCNEWLNSDIDIQPQSCDDVFDAKYCVKHIGRYEAIHAIKCYQCSAADTLDCADGVIHMEGGIEPTECDKVFEAEYCVKSTGLDGGIGAKRFCSSLDLGNYCNYVRQPGDKLEYYRTCIFTCTGDGCNPAASISPSMPFVLFLTISTSTLMTLYKRFVFS